MVVSVLSEEGGSFIEKGKSEVLDGFVIFIAFAVRFVVLHSWSFSG
jgi:hypothetical protein